jgi:DNA-directed RNA polymerase subunit RPC12/RpoP
MNADIEFLCTTCNREFEVSVEEYRSWSGVVPCPGCGCTDLVQLVPAEAAPRTRGGEAA